MSDVVYGQRGNEKGRSEPVQARNGRLLVDAGDSSKLPFWLDVIKILLLAGILLEQIVGG